MTSPTELVEVSWSEKSKLFLQKRLDDYITKIKKLKRKRKIVKILFVSCIVLSITSSAVCAALVSFSIPSIAITILSTTGALVTAISLKFNLKGKKHELNKTIEELDKIKRKIDYIVSCNGNFTEIEYKQIVTELYH
jgi:hypothetical protein